MIENHNVKDAFRNGR